MKCPGQDSRNLQAAMYMCPNCGTDVEMFSDELRARCHKCGDFVYKEKTPSCIDWCAYAKECIGVEQWNALRGALTDSNEGEE